MTTEQIEDPEGRALVEAIHARKRAIEPPMTMMTRPQDWAQLARSILWPDQLVVGVDPGAAAEHVVVLNRATGRIVQ